MSSCSDVDVDVLGIGFGPAALAISIAIAEQNAVVGAEKDVLGRGKQFSSLGGLMESISARERVGQGKHKERKLRSVWVEKHVGGFKWHPGMMLEGSRMQISFLKDLATLRNPTSSYTFLNYLHSLSPSRLLSFISLSTFTPTRREFADYLSWAAKKVEVELKESEGAIEYGQEIVAVEAVLPEQEGGDVERLKVTAKDVESGKITQRYTKNLVVSSGGSPRLPHQLSRPEFWTTGRVIHSSEYLEKADSVLDKVIVPTTTRERPVRIAVIGAGQSAGEIFLALRSAIARRLEGFDDGVVRPEVDLIIRRTALRPADDSAFSNEIFDPGMSQGVYGLDSTGRKQVMKEARNTNYSVMNPNTLANIYETMYAQKVEEDIAATATSTPSNLSLDPKLCIQSCSDIIQASLTSDGLIAITTLHTLTRETKSVEYDAVFCGTGYDRQSWKKILFPAVGEEVKGNAVPLSRLFQSHSPLATSSGDPTSFLDHPSSSTSPSSSLSSTPPSSSPSSMANSALSLPPREPFKQSHNFETKENYRLDLPKEYSWKETKGNFKPTIWLQGSNEDSHGISDSLLSVLAIRSGEVVSGLLEEGWFGEA